MTKGLEKLTERQDCREEKALAVGKKEFMLQHHFS
jgi:hypothetical protein